MSQNRAAVQVANWTISYPVLNAKKTYAVHSIIAFDLAGISHFSRKNYFPLSWSAEETSKIVSTCYTPRAWNQYAWGDCKFVWERLKDSGLWGSSALWRTWLNLIVAEPIAYLHHRLAHFLYFTTTVEYIFHDGRTAEEIQDRQKNLVYKFLQDYVHGGQRLWMFRPIFWLCLAGGCLIAARRCPPVSRRFVTALSLSSLVYLGTYLFVGAGSNFRYPYWAVLATSACTIVLACQAVAALTRKPRDAVRTSPKVRGDCLEHEKVRRALRSSAMRVHADTVSDRGPVRFCRAIRCRPIPGPRSNRSCTPLPGKTATRSKI